MHSKIPAQGAVPQKGWVDWRSLPRPIDWSAVFGREGPLELEIGCGDGGYLVESARLRPDHAFVGIEAKPHRARRTLGRVLEAGLDNIAVLCCDAQVALERLFIQRSLARVVSLFSDPWPKKKHFKFRLFSHRFNRLLNSRLRERSEVLIVTDHRPYCEWILEEVQGCGFEVESGLVGPRFGTRFERIWSDGGQEAFYRVRLVKRRHIDVPVLRDREFPQRDVRTGCLADFKPLDHTGDQVVVFKRVDVDRSLGEALLKAVVVEGRLTQWVTLDVRRRDYGWRLRFRDRPSLIATDGLWKVLDLVQAALERSEQLFSRAPDVR